MNNSVTKRTPSKCVRYRLNPRWVKWRNEIEGIQDFLARLPKQTDTRGKAWVEAMQKHYTSRLKKLNSKEPKRYIRV